VAIDPHGEAVYVANMNDNSVSVIDAATLAILATIPVGASPVGVAADPGGSAVHVANSFDDNVSVIDTASHQVVATVPVGSGPYSYGAFVARAAAPALLLRNLLDELRGMQLGPGVESPLAAHLQQAIRSLARAGASCGPLGRFIDAVDRLVRSRRLPAVDGATLVADARAIASTLQCGTSKR
jgi:YVTN family beta-propeller protein